MLKSHHYRPFDKADKAHKECLSPRFPLPPRPPPSVGILMSVRPTCLPLALLLLIFLPPRPRAPHFLPLPRPFSLRPLLLRCHKLCDCNVRAAAPMPRERSPSVLSRCHIGGPRSRKSTPNRIRGGEGGQGGREIRAGLERRMSREFGYEIRYGGI